MKRVLITGANGFVGNAVCEQLIVAGRSIRCVIRTKAQQRMNDKDMFSVTNIGPDTDWNGAFDEVDSIIHLAARVHVVNESAYNAITQYRMVNTAGTNQLARAASEAGVRRFIYLSSIKVNGETSNETPFTEKDKENPSTPYALSKWEAEQQLWKVAAQTGLEVVIIRPPLVYGPHVRANFQTLMRAVDKRLPLPLASIKNSRSLVSLDNLVDLIILCLEHPAAAGETFFVNDGEDLSTPELIRRIATAMGIQPRLFPLPVAALRAMAKLAGKGDVISRLCESLQADATKAEQLLGWRPRYSVDQSLEKTVSWFRLQHQ